MNIRPQRGFTLIELLVVIAIIGILSAVVLASLGTARNKSRDAARLAALHQVAIALQLGYTTTSAAFTGCTGAYADIRTCTGPATFPNFVDPSGTATPCGPSSGRTCQYSISRLDGSGGATMDNFQVCSFLEVATPTYPAQWVSVTSASGGTIVSGCVIASM